MTSAEPRTQAPLTDSERRWLEVREYLDAQRFELGRDAATVYVAITPRARSRSNDAAVAAARYSSSIVSGIAECRRRVNGDGGISHRRITDDHTR
jgi:hypothetical protein